MNNNYIHTSIYQQPAIHSTVESQYSRVGYKYIIIKKYIYNIYPALIVGDLKIIIL